VSVAPPSAAPPDGTIACPRCASAVGPDQEWCLECGAPARTRLVPTPNWRAPVAALAVVAVLAGLGLAVAFVALTNDSEPAAPVNSQAPPPSATDGQPPAGQTAPTGAATPQPGATTAQPQATTGAPATTTATTGASSSKGSTTGPGEGQTGAAPVPGKNQIQSQQGSTGG
jgi:hypothetical protein